MSPLTLVLRSLLHYWRTNLAVLLGVVAGTAVIGGALVVGDSVWASLERMSLERLGEIDDVLHGERFFRENLADDLSAADGFAARFEHVAPLVVVRGSFVHEETEGRPTRVSQVSVYGVDDRTWRLLDTAGHPVPADDEERRSRDPEYRSPVVLNSRVAGPDGLGVETGGDVSLILEIPETIPGESLFGRTQGATTRLELDVSAVLPAEVPASRLSLQPGQQLPLVAYVPLDRLQRALQINRVESRKGEVESEARVNALFVRARDEADRTGETAPEAAEALTKLVGESWTLADLSLRAQPYEAWGYVAVESDAMIVDDPTARAAERWAEAEGRASSTVLVYLANQFEKLGREEPYSRYGVVAGIEFDAEPPFGSFEYLAEEPQLPLGDDQIVVNSWLADDLEGEHDDEKRLQVGDRLYFTYQPVGSYEATDEVDADFEIVGIVPLDDSSGEPTRAADPGFTPVVPGITDVETYDDWNQPYWMQKANRKVTDGDDLYWDRYRATPKAFLSLERARELFGSRYGGQTSVRIATREGETVNRAAEEIAAGLLGELDPASVGLFFEPLKRIGVEAASGTTSFSGLFVGFSFFLIASATILIVLLFRLGIERRVRQIGLLEALGHAPATVRRQFLLEGAIVVLLGGLLGCVAAVGYGAIVLHGLRTWWSGAIGTRFLALSVEPASLAAGFAISVTITVAAICWSFRGIGRLSARELLAGRSEPSLDEAGRSRRRGWAGWLFYVAGSAALLLVGGILVGIVPDDVEAFGGFSWRVVGFFLVGTLALVASLAEFAAMLDSDRGDAVKGSGFKGIAKLGSRNASRHRQRSVFTTGLIASATFVIVAVSAGRQDLASTAPEVRSGNGGFLLVAESDSGVLPDLNTEEGREAAGFDVDESERALVEDMLVARFRMKPGQDASCLNLYTTRLPTMLGATPETIERGGFAFADTPGENPWKRLEEELPDEDGVPVYPVLGDMNTLTYSLHKGIGQTIAVPDDENPEYKLRVAGMFAGSVFQGVLVLSESNFETLYPDRSGYQYFLVGGRERDGSAIPESRTPELSALLEGELESYGFDAEPIGRRLNAFLAVQNTYLETFQALGGLGLLLGTLGLATVMLRNVLERRAEFALLRAVGFDDRAVRWMVLVENAYLLTWGLVAGTVAALLAMLPQLRSTSADVPWAGTLFLLVIVFAVGMTAALWAVRVAVRTPIVGTLRAE